MKKKILYLLCMCLIFLTLCACEKTDPKTVDYNGASYQDLMTTALGTVETLAVLTDEEKQYYITQGAEVTVNAVTRWDEAIAEAGEYVGVSEDDFSITKSGKTLTTDVTAAFTERNVVISFVYNYNTMELTDITVNPVQSLGEKMSNAGMNTVMGIGTVFVILILISMIIYAFKIIPYLEKKLKKKEVVETSPVVEQITAREKQQDDTELVAVIAAAIAAATGQTTDDFVVRSIKRR